MRYTLMNKNTPVFDVVLDDKSGDIIEVGKIHNIEYAPPGLNPNRPIPYVNDVNKWWGNRAIPASRKGLEKIVKQFGENYSQIFLQKSLGLSLSDQYWINPIECPLKWKDVNFFENDFSDDLGNALFNQEPLKKDIDYRHPDISSEGYLPKQWKIANGKKVLLKAGDYPYFQEPNNEVVASRLLKQLGFEHITYVLGQDGDKQVSICENFITTNTELVTAYQLLNTIPKEEDQTIYAHFKDVLEINNIPRSQRSMDEMLVSDYLINNVDRHFRNFGFIRDVETLEYVGWAPIFDNGNSLWYKQDVALIKDLNEMKPFFANPDMQVDLVESFDNMDFTKIANAEVIIREEFAKNKLISDERIEAICKMVNQRIDCIKLLQDRYFKKLDPFYKRQDVKEFEIPKIKRNLTVPRHDSHSQDDEHNI